MRSEISEFPFILRCHSKTTQLRKPLVVPNKSVDFQRILYSSVRENFSTSLGLDVETRGLVEPVNLLDRIGLDGGAPALVCSFVAFQ